MWDGAGQGDGVNHPLGQWGELTRIISRRQECSLIRIIFLRAIKPDCNPSSGRGDVRPALEVGRGWMWGAGWMWGRGGCGGGVDVGTGCVGRRVRDERACGAGELKAERGHHHMTM